MSSTLPLLVFNDFYVIVAIFFALARLTRDLTHRNRSQWLTRGHLKFLPGANRLTSRRLEKIFITQYFFVGIGMFKASTLTSNYDISLAFDRNDSFVFASCL